MSALPTRFTELVGIEHPIVQEGMGPFKTAKLAAAVSKAGGLGTVSMPGMTADPAEGSRVLRGHIEETASLTRKPFAVNIPVGRTDSGEMLPISEAYIRAVIEARNADATLGRQLAVLTTSAGFPGEFRPLIADAGLIHMHKVGSTRQAVKAEQAGVDVVIASGYEMGGHTHAVPVHTFILLPNVTEAVSVPVLLSGGARDGRTLAAALCLGAAGVAMGTRFIASEDNTDWHPAAARRIVKGRRGRRHHLPRRLQPRPRPQERQRRPAHGSAARGRDGRRAARLQGRRPDPGRGGRRPRHRHPAGRAGRQRHP